MPTYSTEPKYGLRYPSPGAALPDYETYIQSLASDAAAYLKGVTPRVSALPTTGPTGGPLLDGQECYLVADSANGVQWHLRYNASSASVYKWEFVGGRPVVRSGSISPPTSTWTTVGGGAATYTLPVAGDFDLAVSATLAVRTPTAGGVVDSQWSTSVGISVAGGGPITNAQAYITETVGSSSGYQEAVASVRQTLRQTGVTSGFVLALQAQFGISSGSGAGTGQRGVLSTPAVMEIIPVRVG